jgi:hypothetical protein
MIGDFLEGELLSWLGHLSHALLSFERSTPMLIRTREQHSY